MNYGWYKIPAVHILSMRRFQSYINTAEKLVDAYSGEVPFSSFIRSFFSAEKKYGSKDRKQISGLCYQYFRLAAPLKKYGVEERMIAASFLCNNAPVELIEKLQPEWNGLINRPVEDKMFFINPKLQVQDIFPFTQELSPSIDNYSYCLSYLTQPDLFVRVRHLNLPVILRKLEKAGIPYKLLNDNCLQLPPASNTEHIFIPDREAVIQDYNSQRVLNFLKEYTELLPEKPLIWDCCAASGGKSILIYDILKGKCSLTVSDIRPAIISNLHKRFKKASIKNYHYFIADIGGTKEQLPATEYDIIICDAPCTGSGTWSRTPEQLSFFNKAAISNYVKLQTGIVKNTIPHLKKSGLYVYITCSVFKKENEDMTVFIEKEHGLQLLQKQYLEGYKHNADSMFTAVFQK